MTRSDLSQPTPTTSSSFWASFATRLVMPLGLIIVLTYLASVLWGSEQVVAQLSSRYNNVLFLTLFSSGLALVLLVGTFWSNLMEREWFGRMFASMWTPIQVTLYAGWLIPEIPGPLGEKISAVAWALISLVQALN